MKCKRWNTWCLVIFCFIGIVTGQAFSGGMPAREMLVDTDWVWVHSLYNNDTRNSPDTPGLYMVRFNSDGTFTGRADCNRIRGQYRVDGHRLNLSDIISTRAMCPEGSLDRVFLKDLENSASFFFKAGDLYFDLKFHSGTMKFSLSEHAGQAFIPCKDPRPEACTMEYDPVCGRKKDQSTATYGNACEACADPIVLEYIPGECREGVLWM